jgi:hypothetical protein
VRYWFLGGWAIGTAGLGALLLALHAADGPPAYLPLAWAAFGLTVTLAMVAIGIAVVEVGVRSARR